MKRSSGLIGSILFLSVASLFGSAQQVEKRPDPQVAHLRVDSPDNDNAFNSAGGFSASMGRPASFDESSTLASAAAKLNNLVDSPTFNRGQNFSASPDLPDSTAPVQLSGSMVGSMVVLTGETATSKHADNELASLRSELLKMRGNGAWRCVALFIERAKNATLKKNNVNFEKQCAELVTERDNLKRANSELQDKLSSACQVHTKQPEPRATFVVTRRAASRHFVSFLDGVYDNRSRG